MDPTLATTHTAAPALLSHTERTPPLIATLPPAQLALIDLLVLDCDGVLTDGTVWVDALGHESKRFSVIDGHGLAMLHEAGLQLAMITRSPEGIATARAHKLRFQHIHTAILDKGACLASLLQHLQLPSARCAYMGDDLPDLAAYAHAGLTIAPPTARPQLLHAAHARTAALPGHGAVREVCDALLTARLSP
jgi:3-deoxy-D-manno-octulosonate 8-phosphate phosphatase (KDO 8-P phosphatase)